MSSLTLALMGVVGTALLILGLRGRRLDGHPVCRKCRFDLVGTPDVSVCPECGRDVTQPATVRRWAGAERATWTRKRLAAAKIGATCHPAGVMKYCKS